MTELPSFGETIRLAMRLDPSIYRAIQVAPNGMQVALFIVALASISEAMGQSIVLFINRVRPKRYMLALGISTASNMIGYLLWVGVIWLVGTFIFGRTDLQIVAIAAAVGLAYAPQILAFFELLPYWGNPWGIILSLWSMAAITVAISVGVGLTFWQAIVASGLGWLFIQLWRRTLGVPIYALGHWIEDRAAGAPLRFEIRDIPSLRHSSQLLENIDTWRDLLSRDKWEELMEMMNAEQRRGGKTETDTPAQSALDTTSMEKPHNAQSIGNGAREGDTHA